MLALVALCSIAYGSKPIPFATVLDALLRFDPRVDDHLIVHSLRIPRTIVGLQVGVALGLSGAVMQGVARNPLADPGILGVNAGASLFVVVAIYLFGIGSLLGYVWFAFAGAALTSIVVYALGSLGREGATPVKLALAGAAMTALLGSITTAILLVDLTTLDQYRFWAVGSLAGRGPAVAAQVAPFMIVGAVMALASGRLLNALALGDDVARSLGQKVGLARVLSATSCCWSEGRSPPPAPSPSSASPFPMWPAPSPGPTTDGSCPTRPCSAPFSCSAPTSSAASSPLPASFRSGSSPPSSARLLRGPRPPPETGRAVTDVLVVRRARSTGRTRAVTVSVLLLAGIAISFCVSVSVGDFPIPLRDVVPTAFGFGNPGADFVVRTLRLPRALAAVLVGGAFGLSGAIFQSVARNPLASPDIIGVTQGASTAAVVIIVVVGANSVVVSVGAFGGALLAAAAIYFLAYKRGVSSYRLVLVGIGVGAVLAAITEYLLTRANIYDAQQATVWLTGSLNGRGWEHVRPVGVAMLVLFPAVAYLAGPLRAMQLGDDTAKGLGVPVEWCRAGLIVAGVGLASVATASAGPVAFVAFVAPPIARRLVRAPLSLVPAALTGALLLLASDLAGRRLFAPAELPVGVITGIIGAPYLLWLLARANKIGRGG
jgi:iron complex transport system permease protein